MKQIDEPQRNAGSVIVENLQIFQEAFHYIDVIDEQLGAAVSVVFDRVSRRSNWASVQSPDIDGDYFLAARDWRPGEEKGKDGYRLKIVFSYAGEENLWLSEFLEVGDGQVRLYVDPDLGSKAWKTLVNNETGLMDEICQVGFSVEPKTRDLFLPVHFDRNQFARGLADGDLSEAMKPLDEALQLVIAHRALFDRLHDAIEAEE